jgi:hypothetical protein
MRHHLGAEYAESWAKDQHLSELEGMTVLQALDAGVPPRVVWHAVCAVLGLPARER